MTMHWNHRTANEPDLIQALQQDSPGLRKQAAERLKHSTTEETIRQLLQALSDENFWVRARAAEALGHVGAEMAITSLFQAVADENRTVRERAAEALARIGTAEVIEQLGDILGHQTLIETLTRIDAEEAVTGLLQVLNNPHSPLREQALEALARMGSEAAVTGLIKAATDSDAQIRAKAVSHLNNRASLPATDVLHQALRHNDYALRWQAAQALWDLQGSRAVDDLLLVLQDQELDQTGRAQEDQSAIPPCAEIDEYLLIEALSSTNFEAGWQMARSITQFDTNYAAYILERTLDMSWA